MVTPQETTATLLNKVQQFLAPKGVHSPRWDAEVMLAHALGCKRLDLYLRFHEPVPPAALDAMRSMTRRRAQREPLQYIVGQVAFGPLVLQCDARALIPRPETEYLCEQAVSCARAACVLPARILDLGTGTGAIALYMAHSLPQAQVLGIDKSSVALDLARSNAAQLGLAGRVGWLCSDWFTELAQEPGSGWDIILANPPYLTEQEWLEASDEVRVHEPKSALVAPDQGLQDLVQLLHQAGAYLAPAGVLWLEMGLGQATFLHDRALQAGFVEVQVLPDLNRQERFLKAVWPGPKC
jgi:release factor glutamine methyltransferase